MRCRAANTAREQSSSSPHLTRPGPTTQVYLPVDNPNPSPNPTPTPNPATQVYLPVAEAAVGSLDYLVVHARHGGVKIDR
jgi:hypothetical protein